MKEYLGHRSHVQRQTAQAVRRIHDGHGRHCGIWWEQAGYGYVGHGMSLEAESRIDMLEISKYKRNDHRGTWLRRVEGDIPIYDPEHFSAVGPGTGLVNLLVVDWDVGLPDGIGERVTVAIMHENAWEATRPREKEVQIA